MPTAEPDVVIHAVPVAPERDAAFLGDWKRAETERGGASTLYRTLLPAAEFRFVAMVAGGNDAPGLADYAPRSSVYEVVFADDASAAPGPTLINFFEVPADEDDRFLAAWRAARDYLSRQTGYLSTRLHRSHADDTSFRFVNVARWIDPKAFQAAVGDPAFAVSAAVPFLSHPALYEVVVA